LSLWGSDLYAGGEFFTTNDYYNVAKWNGSSWSALGSRGGTVFALGVAGCGCELVAGGDFPIAGWDGSSWSSVGSAIFHVFTLAVSGNDPYAGGWFTRGDKNEGDYIAKYHGFGQWSALRPGLNNMVFSLAASGSNVYAGGSFTTASANEVHYNAKWNGNTWSALSSGMNSILSAGLNAGVRALVVSSDDLYAGGDFSTADDKAANRIAKWNGSSWSPLGSGMGGGDFSTYGAVFALAVSGSDLYAGGNFTTAGGHAANRIAKWNGSSWSALSLAL